MKIVISKALKSSDWVSFDSNAPFLASRRSLQPWQGCKNATTYDEKVVSLPGDYFCVVEIAGFDTIIFGDVNADYAPSYVRLNDGTKPTLAVWKWLGAPQNYTLPISITFENKLLLQKDKMQIIADVYYFCDAATVGKTVIKDPITPRFQLKAGLARLKYYELNPSPSDPDIVFGLYLLHQQMS